MTTTIKKYKGNWLVDDTNGGWIGFAGSSEAIKYAYANGADEVQVHYSSNVMRTFTRKALENFKLV